LYESGFREHDRITTVAGPALPAARGRTQELAEARALAHRNAACVHVMSFQEKAAGIFEAPSRTATASASGAGLVLNCAASTLYMARPWAGAHSRMGELLCVLVSGFQIGRHQGEPASSACPEARTAWMACAMLTVLLVIQLGSLVYGMSLAAGCLHRGCRARVRRPIPVLGRAGRGRPSAMPRAVASAAEPLLEVHMRVAGKIYLHFLTFLKRDRAPRAQAK